MRNFADVVAENFESEVSLVWDLKSMTHAAAKFTVDSTQVTVEFEEREPAGPWHIAFSTNHSTASDRVIAARAFRIFNGVFQAVREFVEIRQPEIVVFISKEPDLASIYGTYLRKETAALEQLGYSVEGPFRIEPYSQYTLRRIRPSAWRS